MLRLRVYYYVVDLVSHTNFDQAILTHGSRFLNKVSLYYPRAINCAMICSHCAPIFINIVKTFLGYTEHTDRQNNTDRQDGTNK